MAGNMDLYITCPTYSTDRLRLRLVNLSDAEDLLVCYSDKAAVKRMNADNCTSDFYYTTIDQMRNCINNWLREYANRAYIRFAVIRDDTAIGTTELFVTGIGRLKQVGVLRIDLASAYETEEILSELAELVTCGMMVDFNAKNLIIKLAHVPGRAAVFEKYGFIPVKQPKGGYYLY